VKQRYYTTTTAAAIPRQAGPPSTRAHAANWGLAVGMLALSVGIAALIAATAAGAAIRWMHAAALIAVALLAASAAFAVKLISYTERERALLYGNPHPPRQYDPPADPLPAEAPTTPAGTFVRGIDGGLHRLDTELDPTEVQAIKRHLLTSGGFTVRAANGILGDDSRASALRVELHRLGILAQPKPRAAAPLTEPGRRTVMRWS
jgi:hypothetical protein